MKFSSAEEVIVGTMAALNHFFDTFHYETLATARFGEIDDPLA